MADLTHQDLSGIETDEDAAAFVANLGGDLRLIEKPYDWREDEVGRPRVGTPDGGDCPRCGDAGFYFDADGHGGMSWKRPCDCRLPYRLSGTASEDGRA
jgi:hypothetical protein